MRNLPTKTLSQALHDNYESRRDVADYTDKVQGTSARRRKRMLPGLH